MSDDLILRVVTKILIPFIVLFALYVQLHGEYGPGGGFQAGVVAAAAFVLYGLVYGLSALRRIVPEPVVETMVAAGVLLYVAIGFAGIALGGTYLDYSVLGSTQVDGQLRGIFWVELGVGITVTGVMLKVFYQFAGRRT